MVRKIAFPLCIALLLSAFCLNASALYIHPFFVFKKFDPGIEIDKKLYSPFDLHVVPFWVQGSGMLKIRLKSYDDDTYTSAGDDLLSTRGLVAWRLISIHRDKDEEWYEVVLFGGLCLLLIKCEYPDEKRPGYPAVYRLNLWFN